MNRDSNQSFSDRHGYDAGYPEISVREALSEDARYTILKKASKAGISASTLREIICETLLRRPNPNNWSQPNVWDECQYEFESCEWYKAYDIVEAICQHLLSGGGGHFYKVFEESVNEYFRKAGIGWQIVSGYVETRGPEVFESAVGETKEVLDNQSRSTASSEIRKTLACLSIRPEPDLTGAIHHAMAAVECVMRDVSGDSKSTLGELLKKHPDLLPKPVNDAVAKLWGFSSERGRHLREGVIPDRVEVEFIVGIAATVASYLAKRCNNRRNL